MAVNLLFVFSSLICGFHLWVGFFPSFSSPDPAFRPATVTGWVAAVAAAMVSAPDAEREPTFCLEESGKGSLDSRESVSKLLLLFSLVSLATLPKGCSKYVERYVSIKE